MAALACLLCQQCIFLWSFATHLLLSKETYKTIPFPTGNVFFFLCHVLICYHQLLVWLLNQISTSEVPLSRLRLIISKAPPVVFRPPMNTIKYPWTNKEVLRNQRKKQSNRRPCFAERLRLNPFPLLSNIEVHPTPSSIWASSLKYLKTSFVSSEHLLVLPNNNIQVTVRC